MRVLTLSEKISIHKILLDFVRKYAYFYIKLSLIFCKELSQKLGNNAVAQSTAAHTSWGHLGPWILGSSWPKNCLSVSTDSILLLPLAPASGCFPLSFLLFRVYSGSCLHS